MLLFALYEQESSNAVAKTASNTRELKKKVRMGVEELLIALCR